MFFSIIVNNVSRDSSIDVKLTVFSCILVQSKHVLEGLGANWFNSVVEIGEIRDSE